eukprot:TRINITY_DN42933_c0_g1_i4.p1 TRINITY_DN42933_c0_g1~~TRINITY_DN42933_c0_g1_i4.p1  ORF type:complete len:163 (-),score=29.65 TRINITY_DN42933_c0_g1_i4:675-1163(-)
MVPHFGYAFINFKSSAYSQSFADVLTERNVTMRHSHKRLTVCAAKHQGFENLTWALKRNPRGLTRGADPWVEEDASGHKTEDSSESTAVRSTDCESSSIDESMDVEDDDDAFGDLKVSPALEKVWRQRDLSMPLYLPLNRSYFEEDPYWVTSLLHEFRIYRL